MREACGDAHLKTILAVGELGSLENVYKASLVCMMAGADFIKTSTGEDVCCQCYISPKQPIDYTGSRDVFAQC